MRFFCCIGTESCTKCPAEQGRRSEAHWRHLAARAMRSAANGAEQLLVSWPWETSRAQCISETSACVAVCCP